ncbi:type II secretion system protein [Bacillus sp. ISL-39]|uniref:type II secretion system protein n=1 Tax=Bacillus sp. ISL-39 TaxID=2819124 RepID=UPI001BEA055B|nr:type II secretion system protein [Bacillus sp. ISL-39]MBT2636351.1 type II secretion system protein [Bacillus sp. ISL-39]
MLKAIKKKMKDQRGLTLVELLAVVVILGIISAIAVPSIGGLIDNSKKDAHVANAQQMINSAKMAVATDVNLQKDTKYLTLTFLETENFLDQVKDPDGKTSNYLKGTSKVPLDTVTETAVVSYVKIVNGKVTGVKLVNSTRGVQDSTKGPVKVEDLERGVVRNN